MILDAGGNAHHLDSWHWERRYVKLQSQVIDIQTDRHQYYMRRLTDDMSFEHQQADFHDFKMKNMDEHFDWTRVLLDAVPCKSENDDWVF